MGLRLGDLFHLPRPHLSPSPILYYPGVFLLSSQLPYRLRYDEDLFCLLLEFLFPIRSTLVLPIFPISQRFTIVYRPPISINHHNSPIRTNDRLPIKTQHRPDSLLDARSRLLAPWILPEIGRASV